MIQDYKQYFAEQTAHSENTAAPKPWSLYVLVFFAVISTAWLLYPSGPIQKAVQAESQEFLLSLPEKDAPKPKFNSRTILVNTESTLNPSDTLANQEKIKVIEDVTPTLTATTAAPAAIITATPEATATATALTEVAPLPKEPEILIHKIKVKPGDTVSGLFSAQNITAAELAKMLQVTAIKKHLSRIRPGQIFEFHTSNGEINKILYHLSLTDYVVFQEKNGSYTQQYFEVPLESKYHHVQANIKSSLFVDGKNAGLSEKLIFQFIDLFGWDIDFTHDIRRGDSFSVIYESKYIKGKKIRDSRIIAARFTNKNQNYHAFLYGKNKPSYYDAKGYGLKKSFLRAPLKYNRISSHFTLGRKHPILHKIRAHKGVDFAAPRGTPVKASGDGRVIFIGWKGGYGRTVILQHGASYKTLYAHLSRYDKNLRKGQKISQGQTIAYVGSSGLATGPHLHYEFHVNNQHQDPLKIKLPRSPSIDTKDAIAFDSFKEKMLLALESPPTSDEVAIVSESWR